MNRRLPPNSKYRHFVIFVLVVFFGSIVMVLSSCKSLKNEKRSRQSEVDKKAVAELAKKESAPTEDSTAMAPIYDTNKEVQQVGLSEATFPAGVGEGSGPEKESAPENLSENVIPIYEIPGQDASEAGFHKDYDFLLNCDFSGFKGILTFDDGPHPSTTPEIIQILEKAGIKNVIFFFLGYRMIEYPDLVRMVDEAGYEIGFHSMYHQNFVSLTAKQIRKDIKQFKRSLNNVLGRDYPLRIGRPPYGGMTTVSVKVFRDLEKNGKLASKTLSSPFVEKLVHPKIADQFMKNNLELMLWNVDFDDWEQPLDTVHLENSFAPNFNQVFLFHEMPIDIRAMEMYDNEIEKRFPQFLVTLSELHNSHSLKSKDAIVTDAPKN